MRIPTATYRIQFSPSFGFRAARGIVPYLAELGISDLYASPIFRARKGSPHGYDVVDQNQLNPELGPEEDFGALSAELNSRGMGWLQDIVPNHMAFASENRPLMDVLENGEDSEYFDFFDIELNHPYETMRGRLLAPFLGSFYADSLEQGEIRLEYGENGFAMKYYDLRLPLKIDSYATILSHDLGRLKQTIGREHPDLIKLLGIIYALKTLPSKDEISERHDQIMFIKKVLWELYTTNMNIREFLDDNIKGFNGEKGDPESFNLLDGLLGEQLFRLSFWKVATEELNYRRFFNINSLISLRTEDDKVFDFTHSFIFRLIAEGQITGLRIDHIDGLYDPTKYLKRLRGNIGDIFVIVEKVLGYQEELPQFWPVEGTSGYDFLNQVNGIFCAQDRERELTGIYRKLAGPPTTYETLVADKKRLMIGKDMAGDVDNLAHLMKRISSRDRYAGDVTLYGLKRALVEVLAWFPVYRTYVSQDIFTEKDRSCLMETVAKAIQRNPGLLYELKFIERFLLLRFGDHLPEEEQEGWVHFAMRFQQFTGPLMAKGFEDTTLYIYNRLISLNEVGGSPNIFGISLSGFHQFNQNRGAKWPHTLNATSTHDTKRGEDVRARINVLSEIPAEWENNLRGWRRINRTKKKSLAGTRVPEGNDEYFLYQTLVGAYPAAEEEMPPFLGRLKSYVVKAVREAKVHTAWLKPDTDYEDAFTSFVEEILRPSEHNEFLKTFLPFQKKVSHYGMLNSLSQTLLKLTAPGVPDFYQGSELWDLNLVDPDNRRPVDFAKRSAFLQDIKTREQTAVLELIAELLERPQNGKIKLFLIYRALKARTERAEVFRRGDYIPLEVSGRYGLHVVAFARHYEDAWTITVAPRLLTAVVRQGEYPLGRPIWDDTRLIPVDGLPSSWTEVVTGQWLRGEQSLLVGEILKYFPVGLLTSEDF